VTWCHTPRRHARLLAVTVQKQRRRAQADANRSDVESRIVAAAEGLIAGQPYSTIGIDDIMKAAGLGRTAFYRYFDDQETLLLRLFDTAVIDLRGAAAAWLEHDSTDIEGTLRKSMGAYGRHAALLRAMADTATSDPRVAAAYRVAVECFVDAAEQRILREQAAGHAVALDPRATAEALIWMNERYEYAAFRDSDVDPERVVNTLAAIWRRTLFGTV
jgi:TetR/AcrR family transcriptional regulator, ethionamide resistance regulator